MSEPATQPPPVIPDPESLAPDWWDLVGAGRSLKDFAAFVMGQARGECPRGDGIDPWSRHVWEAFGRAGVPDGSPQPGVRGEMIVLQLAGLVYRLAGEVEQLRAEVNALHGQVGGLDRRTVGMARFGPPDPSEALRKVREQSQWAAVELRNRLLEQGHKPLTVDDLVAMRRQAHKAAAAPPAEAHRPVEPHPTGGFGE